MSPDTSLTPSQLEELLRAQAETLYGTGRAKELNGNIRQIALHLSIVGGRELSFHEVPPDTRGIRERNTGE